jgi:hypothetical protein
MERGDILSVIRNYRMLLHGSGANAHSLRKTRKSYTWGELIFGITVSHRDENVYTGAAGAATQKRRKI